MVGGNDGTLGSGNLSIFKNSWRKKVMRMRCFNDVERDMVVLYIVRGKLINICLGVNNVVNNVRTMEE